LIDRLAILVAARRVPGMGDADYRSLFIVIFRSTHTISFVDLRRFLRDVRRYFMQRLFVTLHGTLGSYLRDALHEGSVDVVACLHVPRA
jgi:hypothetical protein